MFIFEQDGALLGGFLKDGQVTWRQVKNMKCVTITIPVGFEEGGEIKSGVQKPVAPPMLLASDFNPLIFNT